MHCFSLFIENVTVFFFFLLQPYIVYYGKMFNIILHNSNFYYTLHIYLKFKKYNILYCT